MTDAGAPTAPKQPHLRASAVVSVGLTTGMVTTCHRHACLRDDAHRQPGAVPDPYGGAIILVAVSPLVASRSVVSAALPGVE